MNIKNEDEIITTCKLIYNPVSTGFKIKNVKLVQNEIEKLGIKTVSFESTYPGAVKDIIKNEDDSNTLLLTIGGDGTVSEAYESLARMRQKGVYSHIPTGTTNDMALNYNVTKKNPDEIIIDILNGEIVKLDSYSVNDKIAAYSSVFGLMAHIPYVTDNKYKKVLGHGAYVTNGLKELFKKINKYDVTCTTDDGTFDTKCIIGAVSNSKGFAGVKLFPDAKLNDGKLEYFFLEKLNPKLVATLLHDYLLNKVDLTKYSDIIITGKTSFMKIKFNGKIPKYPIDIDGENKNVNPTYIDNEYNIKLESKIKVLKSKKSS